MTYLVSPDAPAVTEYATVCIAWELSKADWKVGVLVPGAEQMSRFTIKGGDLAAAAARRARRRQARGAPPSAVTCGQA